ncbi:hypothetical protein JCM11641_006886 [Rhodosporidiobolus odoratus]
MQVNPLPRATPLAPATNPRWGDPPPLSHHDPATALPDQTQLKKGAKAKDLSHVPCKFYKANSCTAGKACPFSHDLGIPGTTKPLCQWFAKGNCKFGHKCALAHVLPGQPLSFDRKNKREEKRLRDAQLAAEAGIVTPANATAQSQRPPNEKGLAQTLQQAVTLGRVDLASLGYLNGSYGMNGMNGMNGLGTRPPSSPGASEAIFGSPDSLGHRTPASSPGLQHQTLPHHHSPHSPLSFSASLAPGQSPTFMAPVASGLSHHFGSNGHSSFAARAMLSEQARRLSATSNGEPLSPPRVAQLNRARLSFNGASAATDLPASPPLAVPTPPGAPSGNSSSATIFGTSPFSGSRGLFIPSSYDSNEDGFPRSPPGRLATLPDMTRGASSGGWTLQGLAAEEAIADEDDFDEAFLPSSLNDLLTPEEMRRRTLRANTGPHGPSSLSKDSMLLSSPAAANAFLNSKSVPAELLLSNGKPTFPTSLLPTPSPLAPRSASTNPSLSSYLGSSMDGTNPSAMPYEPPTRSLLTQSRTVPASVTSATSTTASPLLSSSASTVDAPPFPSATSSLLSATLSGGPSSSSSTLARPPPIYSSSFSTAPHSHSHYLSHHTANSSRFPQSGSSPNTNASLAAPGSSLPGGLAAGLSRLHLVPSSHTGETPPSSSYASAAAAGMARGGQQDRAGSGNGSEVAPGDGALARRISGHSTSTSREKEETVVPGRTYNSDYDTGLQPPPQQQQHQLDAQQGHELGPGSLARRTTGLSEAGFVNISAASAVGDEEAEGMDGVFELDM